MTKENKNNSGASLNETLGNNEQVVEINNIHNYAYTPSKKNYVEKPALLNAVPQKVKKENGD